jgi:hypothetical protein
MTSFLWFALTFWVYLETRSVLATSVIGGAFAIFSSVFGILFGTFVDQGVAGEDFVGKTVPMRTLIRIEGPDRHVIELYFTPPGKGEALATRAVYTRTGP